MREWLSGGAPPVRAVRGPPDLVRRLALFLFIAEALILQGCRSFCVCMKL